MTEQIPQLTKNSRDNYTHQEMNLNKANLAIKVAIERANVIGAKFCIAVMDAGVNLVAFSRMDGGRVGTIDVAMKKVSTQIRRRENLALVFSAELFESCCELRRFTENIQTSELILRLTNLCPG